jgi:hypothetical protein
MSGRLIAAWLGRWVAGLVTQPDKRNGLPSSRLRLSMGIRSIGSHDGIGEAIEQFAGTASIRYEVIDIITNGYAWILPPP